MTSKDLEQVLDEANCIDLNFPYFTLNFPSKDLADIAQKSLFEYFGKRDISFVFEYQEHSAKLSLYDVELGNDVIINVPFCEDEKSTWFDNRKFNQHPKVSIFCGYGKIKNGTITTSSMADFIDGLDDGGIRNIIHFSAKRV